MANHKSAEKRIRQNSKRRLANRYFGKTTRNLIRDFRAADKKADAQKSLPKVVSLLDKLAKRGNIHKNKASNLKSKLMKRIAGLKK
ncbi:MAG: 30S ribosomal protein S20 [Bacteroidetes bacterium]|nr:30S ribosomal protein S20 [Bacteroidota bacterium]